MSVARKRTWSRAVIEGGARVNARVQDANITTADIQKSKFDSRQTKQAKIAAAQNQVIEKKQEAESRGTSIISTRSGKSPSMDSAGCKGS